MEEKTLIVVNEDGTEQQMEILFTFDDDQFKKNYVLYIDPQDESGEVFVSSFTEEGELNVVTDEKEWAMIEEVFNAFVIQNEGSDEEGCACGHDHSHNHEEGHECSCKENEKESCGCGHEHNH